MVLTKITPETAAVVYKGTQYKKGFFVVADQNDNGYVFGRIKLMLLNQSVIFCFRGLSVSASCGSWCSLPPNGFQVCLCQCR